MTNEPPLHPSGSEEMEPPEARITRIYGANRPLYVRLEEEIKFILGRSLPNDVKLHSLTSRIKDLAGVNEKAIRKNYADAFTEMNDIVGVRVVCLFLSDIQRLAAAIRDAFDVKSETETIEGDDASAFGYMAMHFEATLPGTCIGPRYDDLKTLIFEIQLRTLLMDAWANVSHHLDYKREASIPSELRRDFFALSGLFYIADRHFELFMQASDESLRRATHTLSGSHTIHLDLQELNTDTLYAFLRQKYPDRRTSTRENTSQLAAELIGAGLTTLADADALLERAERAVWAYERDLKPGQPTYFSGVGVLRVAAQFLVTPIRAALATSPAAPFTENDKYRSLISDEPTDS